MGAANVGRLAGGGREIVGAAGGPVGWMEGGGGRTIPGLACMGRFIKLF